MHFADLSEKSYTKKTDGASQWHHRRPMLGGRSKVVPLPYAVNSPLLTLKIIAGLGHSTRF